MGEVKKFWADLCVHHIEAVRYSDYAALEAELATVKKVAYGNMELLEENAKLRAELERRAVPDGFRVMLPTSTILNEGDRWEIYAPCGSGGIVHEDDVTDWVVRKLLDALAAAPSAPKADPVKVQLLEALENTATWIEQLPVPTAGAAGQLVKIDKAIAAARQEGKV